jgi:hypothetical protein
MAEALRDGAAGLSPFPTGVTRARRAAPARDTQATRVVAAPNTGATRATRMAPAEREAAPPVVRLEPRRAPRTAPRGAPEPYERAPRRRSAPPPARARQGSGRAARRMIALLILLCVLGAAIIVAVSLANSTSTTVRNLRQTVSHDINTEISNLHKLIQSNTK